MKRIQVEMVLQVPNGIEENHIASYFQEIGARLNEYLQDDFKDDDECDGVICEISNVYER